MAKTGTGGRTRSFTLQARSVFIQNGKVCQSGRQSSWWLIELGVRRGINYTWAFMLLGQIVAISFATNLYFLTLLLNPKQQQSTTIETKDPASVIPKSDSKPSYRRFLGPWIIDFLSVISTRNAANLLGQDRYQSGAPGFMQILLLPHIALMVLPTLRAILPATFFPLDDTKTLNRVYGFLWLTTAYFFCEILLWETYKNYRAGILGDIGSALFEHPAVSSVGLDVIFCWLSWICWWQTQGGIVPDI